jgi:hypothetical protein
VNGVPFKLKAKKRLKFGGMFGVLLNNGGGGFRRCGTLLGKLFGFGCNRRYYNVGG